MPSPFPGMDPYLEDHWGDVHARLMVYSCDQLQKRLPPDLRARVEERVSLESPVEKERQRVPDMRVVEDARGPGKRRLRGANGLAVAEPFVVHTEDPVTERSIEIRDVKTGDRVVTVIEVLSPTNKLPGTGRIDYLKKREDLRMGRVNLVEIDLLRIGPRPYPFHLNRLPLAYHTPYQAWVRRGASDTVEVFRIPLRESLPNISIPLRPADDDVLLQLQPLIEQCYNNGDYESDIDYDLDPVPPLDISDAKWADAVLRKAGLRKSRRSKRK